MLADAKIIAGFKAGPGERRDHADLDQALLEIGKRLLVGEIVALKKQLDPAPEDAICPIAFTLDPVATLSDGAIDPVLGLKPRAECRLNAHCLSLALGELKENATHQLLKTLSGGRGNRQHA